MITGRVKEIQPDQFQCKLTAKVEDLASHAGFITLIWPQLDRSFSVLPEDIANTEFDPIRQIELEKKEAQKVNKRYTPRKIMHKYFKNFTYKAAVVNITK